jgi:RNA polymerase sigma factor (sigma-70 family)
MTEQAAKYRLADWFRQWRMPLRRFLIGRGAAVSDLDDVAQEVFLRLMRYELTDLIEHPQAYLYKMAANVAAEWAIRGRQVRLYESEWVTVVPAEDRVEDHARHMELQDEVERALHTLTAQQRAVMKLHFFEGLGRTQIAERLGTTERSVKRVLMKSYEKLRHQLDSELLGGISDGRK